MTRLRFSCLSLCLLFAISIVTGISVSAESSKFTTETLKHIKWREIGPTSFGGRIDDIEAVPENPKIIFIAAASSGIFKSDDNALTWKAVFDEEGTSLSIGDIAIAPSDPNIVWAGTGEPNNRQSSSWGDGVFKSLDGGETWMPMGLKETHHIGRIAIHPHNPDIVYAAACGHLWGPNEERGLYRTEDGGKTWEKLIYINPDTGFVDVAIEGNGRVIYAASYQRRRRGWGFIGGGPHSGLYRSMDGGETWEKLTKDLPEGDTGRIGIEISKSHPHIVYIILQHKNGGVFRSEDRGESWTHMSSENPRPSYYSQIRIDPKNPNKIFIFGFSFYVSIDGGKTFKTEGTWDRVHPDHHTLWINPNDSDHLMLAGDGGFYISYNGSKTWDFINNIPLAQFYAIGIDTRDPYWIYGGAQDHGGFGLPSRTDNRLGILNSDCVPILFGDGFHCLVDPGNPNLLYASNQQGRLLRINLETHEETHLRPVPEDSKESYRFAWKTALAMSPHDSSVLYYGANKLMKTSDRGNNWEEISPDLSNNQDWRKLPIMGMIRDENTLSQNDGVGHYGAITAISESPIQADLIYAGTDDGNVHMTKDGGAAWENMTKNFRLPGPRWVCFIHTSHHDTGTAYVCFSGHRDDDFTAYIFKTTDFGTTWKSISGDIPDGMTVNSIAEHPRNPDLLFAGTEFGLFISINSGKNWVLARGNLPRVPVDDIIIQARDNDLILGTHGRGFIILDDIAMLEKLTTDVLNADAYLFPPRDTLQYLKTREIPDPGASQFAGPNPDYGALITYYLKDDPPASEEKSGKKPKVKITILDENQNVVRTLKGPDKKGLNRINWDLHYPLSFDTTGIRGGVWAVYYWPFTGPFALPGVYTVKLEARGQELTQKVRVKMDPRANASSAELKKRFNACMTVDDMQRAVVEGRKAASETTNELKKIKKIIESKEDISQEIKDAVEGMLKKMEEMNRPRRGWPSLMDMAGALQASFSGPTQGQQRIIRNAKAQLEKNIETLNSLITKELPELQSKLLSQGIRLLICEPIKPPKK